MRKLITNILKSLSLEDFVRSRFQQLRYAKRWIFRTDKRIIKNYFGKNEKYKLQIGCGSNILDGWLNSNFYPKSNKVLHVDATKNYPFNNNSFDFVYSEHMIEHINYSQGTKMLKECFRVLKPKGTLRIVTPDLLFLLDLYKKNKTELQLAYIEDNTKRFIKDAPYIADIFVINNFFRDWDHQFIYDSETLQRLFKDVGFTNIVQCDLNESIHKDLKNLAHEDRYPSGFLKLESLIIEGTKP